MQQVAELRTAERVIAEILYKGAPIGVRVRLRDLFFRQVRVVFEQQRADPIRPEEIDYFHVREHRIGRQLAVAQKQDDEDGRHTDKQASHLYLNFNFHLNVQTHCASAQYCSLHLQWDEQM